jgi:hypothetical protein
LGSGAKGTSRRECRAALGGEEYGRYDDGFEALGRIEEQMGHQGFAGERERFVGKKIGAGDW